MTEDFYDKVWLRSKRAKIYGFRKIAANMVSSNKLVLDVGCGDGLISEHLIKKGFRVVGIDIAVSGLKQAKYRGVSCVRCSAYHLPFKENSFDSVMMSEILEHLDTPENALLEMRRAVEHNAQLVVTVPNSGYWIYRLKCLFGATQKEAQGNPTHVQFFSFRSLEALLSRLGFRIKKVVGITEIPKAGFFVGHYVQFEFNFWRAITCRTIIAECRVLK